MEFRDNVSLDGTTVRSAGGGRRGGTPVAVGGIGGILLLILSLIFGQDLLGGSGTTTTNETVATADAACQSTNDIKDNPDCRWAAYERALSAYWTTQFSNGFEDAAVITYSGQTATACGTGSSEMGPFYCPGDKTIYLDTAYMQTLFDQLGAEGGYAAELYVVGHEYGHHISNLTGDMNKAHAAGNDSGPTSNSVRLELQADCYAGVFFRNAVNDEQKSIIGAVTRDDLLKVADAAKAVGDDHIQAQSSGRVVPESWTHGSSQMRRFWVAKGYDAGDPAVCDTFSTDELGQ